MYPEERTEFRAPPEIVDKLVEFRLTQLEERVAGVEQEIRDHADEFNKYRLDVLGAKDTTAQNLIIGPIVTTIIVSIVNYIVLRMMAPPIPNGLTH